jgi:hypothetical protein
MSEKKRFNLLSLLSNTEVVLGVNLVGLFLIISCVLAVITSVIIIESVVKNTSTDIELTNLKGIILQYDEILTMSGKFFSFFYNILTARLAASKNDTAFVKRYEDSVPILDSAINRALTLSPPYIRSQVDNYTNVANQALIAMETQALNDVLAGNPRASLQLLFSEEYTRQKGIYSQGMSILFNYILTQAQIHITLSTTFTIIIICVLSFVVPISCVIGFDSILQRGIIKKIQEAQRKKEEKMESKTKKMKDLLLNDLLNNSGKLRLIEDSIENNLVDLMQNPKAKKKFHSFCQREWSLENLLIYDEINE